MWYFYAIESLKSGQLYKGYTSDLKRRFGGHNQKRGGAYTSKIAPFKLIYYEAYLEKEDAIASEEFFETGYGREVLSGKIKNYLNSHGG